MTENKYIRLYSAWYGKQVAQVPFEKETKSQIVVKHNGKQKRFNKVTGKEVGGSWNLIEKSEYVEIVSKILNDKLANLQGEIANKQKEYDNFMDRLNEIKELEND